MYIVGAKFKETNKLVGIVVISVFETTDLETKELEFISKGAELALYRMVPSEGRPIDTEKVMFLKALRGALRPLVILTTI